MQSAHSFDVQLIQYLVFGKVVRIFLRTEHRAVIAEDFPVDRNGRGRTVASTVGRDSKRAAIAPITTAAGAVVGTAGTARRHQPEEMVVIIVYVNCT